MKMNTVASFELAEKFLVPFQRQIGMKAALHEDTATAQLERLFNLSVNLFETQDVTFRRAGLAVERAERANSCANVAVVNIAVHDVRDDVVRMQPAAKPIGQLLNCFERCLDGKLKIFQASEVFALYNSVRQFFNNHKDSDSTYFRSSNVTCNFSRSLPLRTAISTTSPGFRSPRT